MKQEAFNLYSRYYKLLYADKSYTDEVKYVVGLLKKYHPQAKSILEYGSGTGGHGLLIQEQGYQVHGIELSETMAKQATEAGLSCQVGDISNFIIPQRFDAVLALFHVISYLNKNEQLIAALKNAYTHLEENGICIFDVWYSPAVYHQKPVTRIKTAEDQEIRLWRFAEPKIHSEKNVVDVNYKVLVQEKESGRAQEIVEVHPMRHFSVPEVEILAMHCGFELLHTEEFLSGAAPSENTWGVCFILKKKKNEQ